MDVWRMVWVGMVGGSIAAGTSIAAGVEYVISGGAVEGRGMDTGWVFWN